LKMGNAGEKHNISPTHLMRHPGERNGWNRLGIRSKRQLLSDFPSDRIFGYP
jgi:hypothetical protein